MQNKEDFMIEDDTIKLLKECSSGTTMAIHSIDEILEKTKNDELKKILSDSKNTHKKLATEVDNYLKACHDEPKDPSAMAKSMSFIKTNVKMTTNPGDDTIADLITEGCNMGIKSLYRYLNQYKNADKSVIKLANEIIDEEENLRKQLRFYL